MTLTPFIVADGRRHVGLEAIRSRGVAPEVLCGPENGSRSTRHLTLANTGASPLLIERAGFMIHDAMVEADGDWRVFIDSGTLAWHGVRRLNDLAAGTRSGVSPPIPDTAEVCHRSSLQTVLWNAGNREGLLVGYCSQQFGQNCIDIWPSQDCRTIRGVEAWQEFALRPLGGAAVASPIELAPGEMLETDPLRVAFGNDPLALLDEFGQLVQKILGARFDEPPITGHMTWYCQGDAIDTETVAGNLPILEDIFTGYPQPQRPVLIVDHGWQVGASLGPVEADPGRFPDGLEGLAETIRRHGLEPGLWLSLTNVTEDASNYAEIAPLLARDEDGAPLHVPMWIWGDLPGERYERIVHVPDAARDETREWWRDQLRYLSEIGMRYFKMDFLALRTSDGNRSHARSGELHDLAWETFRSAVPKGAHLAPCSCDTNLALNRCDSVRVSADIGEAGYWPGALDGYREALSSIAAMWYKHRRFWINDPDSVQIGKGCSMGEARVRATTAAFSGGHLMLSEDLRCIDAARLELFRRLLPAIPTAAVPVDLFEHPFPDGYPSMWRLTLDRPGGPVTAVALFNLDERTRAFRLSPDLFGIPADAEYLALEWWQGRWLGRMRGECEIDVPPCDVAVVHARAITEHPALISCSHHPTGMAIVDRETFDPDTGALSFTLVTRPGLKAVVFGQVPAGWNLSRAEKAHAVAGATGGWQREVATADQRTDVAMVFERKEP